jgi:TDG/mug DNA glycosylase family protein
VAGDFAELRTVREGLTSLPAGSRVAVLGTAPAWVRREARERGVVLASMRSGADLFDAAVAFRATSPLELARLHARLRTRALLRVPELPAARERLEDAGFAVRSSGGWLRARRVEGLPDFVRANLELLICGLNPSLHAARTGIPFSRPGNRFWPAALRAGIVARDRDPEDALRRGVGFTDFCKRATRAAGELTRAEYARGAERLARKVQQLRPRALCFVGLEGWRRTQDRRAGPGWTPAGFAGRPAYLMPSTSGRNASTSLAELTAHLRRAYTGAPRRMR